MMGFFLNLDNCNNVVDHWKPCIKMHWLVNRNQAELLLVQFKLIGVFWSFGLVQWSTWVGSIKSRGKKNRSYTYFFLLILWNNNLFFSLFLIGELFRYYQKIAAVQNFLTANISNAILKPVKQMLYKKLDMIETWGCQVSFKHTIPGK